MKPVGYHFLLELSGCPRERLDDPGQIERALAEAAAHAELTVLGEISHHFEPHGVTAIALLSESHLSIHTWPEYRYAAVDLFSCCDPRRAESACQLLAAALGAEEHSLSMVRRGLALGTRHRRE